MKNKFMKDIVKDMFGTEKDIEKMVIAAEDEEYEASIMDDRSGWHKIKEAVKELHNEGEKGEKGEKGDIKEPIQSADPSTPSPHVYNGPKSILTFIRIEAMLARCAEDKSLTVFDELVKNNIDAKDVVNYMQYMNAKNLGNSDYEPYDVNFGCNPNDGSPLESRIGTLSAYLEKEIDNGRYNDIVVENILERAANKGPVDIGQALKNAGLGVNEVVEYMRNENDKHANDPDYEPFDLYFGTNPDDGSPIESRTAALYDYLNQQVESGRYDYLKTATMVYNSQATYNKNEKIEDMLIKYAADKENNNLYDMMVNAEISVSDLRDYLDSKNKTGCVIDIDDQRSMMMYPDYDLNFGCNPNDGSPIESRMSQMISYLENNVVSNIEKEYADKIKDVQMDNMSNDIADIYAKYDDRLASGEDLDASDLMNMFQEKGYGICELVDYMNYENSSNTFGNYQPYDSYFGTNPNDGSPIESRVNAMAEYLESTFKSQFMNNNFEDRVASEVALEPTEAPTEDYVEPTVPDIPENSVHNDNVSVMLSEDVYKNVEIKNILIKYAADSENNNLQDMMRDAKISVSDLKTYLEDTNNSMYNGINDITYDVNFGCNPNDGSPIESRMPQMIAYLENNVVPDINIRYADSIKMTQMDDMTKNMQDIYSDYLNMRSEGEDLDASDLMEMFQEEGYGIRELVDYMNYENSRNVFADYQPYDSYFGTNPNDGSPIESRVNAMAEYLEQTLMPQINENATLKDPKVLEFEQIRPEVQDQRERVRESIFNNHGLVGAAIQDVKNFILEKDDVEAVKSNAQNQQEQARESIFNNHGLVGATVQGLKNLISEKDDVAAVKSDVQNTLSNASYSFDTPMCKDDVSEEKGSDFDMSL